MRSTLVSLAAALAAGVAGTHSCSSDASPDLLPGEGVGKEQKKLGGVSAPAARSARPVQRGRFADAVQVGKNRWVLLDDRPPPLEGEEELGPDDRGGDDGGGRRRPGGERKKRFGQSPVYVDGVPIAVVAYGELPPWLPTRWVALNDGRKVIRFAFGRYLAALGVPLRRVRAVHFHGGRGRVAVLSGAELRRVRDRLLFSFTRGDAGKMRMHWDGDIAVSDSIDKIEAIAVYVGRKPPRWDRRAWSLVGDDGEQIHGIPYAEEPLKGGVRIYLDGRIAHVFKRNRAFARKIEPVAIAEGVPTFAMFPYLREMGVDGSKVVAMELMAENRVARRLDGAALAARRQALALSAPPRSSGRILVHLGPAPDRVEVTAIQLYTAKRAGARERR